ncbi:zf-HC2 domain-containing protein [Antribacter gilvus]|uniref:zf-HC2 domain-containing protein n=1 Tax=Antribacter gilvus TaxID=2304675 RepID=UPI0013E04F18|nr:zf-HC2 domain-containing protein [Antribacter gilvus]
MAHNAPAALAVPIPAPQAAWGVTIDRVVGCTAVRAALRDYLRSTLMPAERRRLDDHLVGCPGCLRAFTDTRVAAWTSPATTRRLRQTRVAA